MRIVADQDIPRVREYFSAHGDLILKPGRMITTADVSDADVLLVRSITHVNATLLKNSRVQFVGSATTGADHLDIEWLAKMHIHVALAKGCNRDAVLEYVFAAVKSLRRMHKLPDKSLRSAVIGVGMIGSEVAKHWQKSGMEVILCDPFRRDNEPDFLHTALAEISNVDLITLHIPLTKTGDYPTYHLITREFLMQQNPGTILINTSRGSVMDSSALKTFGRHLCWCLDVFEHEPEIDVAVLADAFIATPHIAGYTDRARLLGTQMVHDAFCAWLNGSSQQIMPPPSNVMLGHYDPLEDTAHMKAAIQAGRNVSEVFDQLRKNYHRP